MRTITDHLIDIIQNSIKANAKSIKIEFIEDYSNFVVKFSVEDNGCGIKKNDLSKIFDPFFTTRNHKIRKVGIGLPLLKENAELTGGYVKIESEEKKGTRIETLFKSNSIDMPDIGNLVDMYISILNLSDNIDFFIKRVYNKKSYIIDTNQLKKIVGVSLSEPLIYNEMVEFFKKKERSVKQNA
jgi:hypothetical protein